MYIRATLTAMPCAQLRRHGSLFLKNTRYQIQATLYKNQAISTATGSILATTLMILFSTIPSITFSTSL